MPVYPCKWPTCGTYISRPGYCPDHADKAAIGRSAIQAKYDRLNRDRESKRFYNSAAWQRARARKLRRNPICERCREVVAQHVHHKVPVKVASASERINPALLLSLCIPCHNEIEAEIEKRESDTDVRG